MEDLRQGHTFPFTFESPVNGPSSPPTTPGSRAQPVFPPFAGQPARPQRNGFAALSDSPPMDFDPKNPGPPFAFLRSHPREQFSRTSTASPVTDSTQQDSSPEVDSASDEEVPEQRVRRIIVEEGDFTVEEVSDHDSNRYLPVVQPDQFEDITSDQEAGESLADSVAGRLRNLNCATDVDTDEELERRRAERKGRKRWSGLIKRSHSKSEDGGSEVDGDNSSAGVHEPNIRRPATKQRRLTKPSERSSPILNSLKGARACVEEPGDDDDVVLDWDTGEVLGQMPFSHVRDPMDIDSDADQCP